MTDWQMSIESKTRRRPRVAEPEHGTDLEPDLRLVATDQLLRPRAHHRGGFDE